MRSLPLSGRRLAVAVGTLAVVALAAGSMAASAATTRTTASDTLVVDKSFDLKTSDPQRQFEPTGGIIDHAMYDSLLRFSGADVSHPKPSAASSYKASADAKTYTFQLRKNIKFSDGTPLTSKDVVFSFNRLVNLKGNPSFLLAGITTKAKGPYTVVLTSKTPNPAIPVLVANTSLGIVNSKVVLAHGGSAAVGADKKDKAESYLNAHSAGSGPYTLKSFSTTSQVVLTANPTYWGPKPKFRQVVVRNVQAATQLLDVQRGTNEISMDLSPDQAKGLAGKSNINVAQTPSPNMFFLFANHNPSVSATSANAHIQNAIRLGLDYSGLVTLVGTGAVQATGVVPSMFLGALKPGSGLKTDLTKAKAEVAASGVSNPTLSLEFPSDFTSNGLSFGVIAQRIQSDLGKIGITVNLAGSPIATSLGTYRAGTEQLGLWYWGPDYPDPNDYLAFLPGATVGLRAGWPAGADPSLEALGKKASAIVSPKARGAAFQQIQQQLNANGPFFPLFQPGQVTVSSKNLTNDAFNALYWMDVAAVGSN
jgi:peptide/nickel transport system substrate-binding protein